MQIRELSKPITSKMLNENLAKNFGYKINFEQFNDVQLEDARNKLRTKLSQFEVNESYDSLHDSRDYQKTRMFLDCINQEIMEREESKEEDKCECDELGQKECPIHCDDEPKKRHTHKGEKDMDENMNESYITHAVRNRAKKLSVPESWINSTLDKIRAGEDDREELKAELTVRYDLNESQASWILLEGEEDKAKVIMATKDMVDRVTGWLEDTAAMKAEQLLELQDSIRETLGSDVAQQYGDAVKPALEAVYTALETSRQGLQGALALVSGGEAPMMGATPSPDAMGAPAMPDAEPMLGAQGGMAPEETPPGPELDRMKRENVDYSRRLGQLLAQSKKK